MSAWTPELWKEWVTACKKVVGCPKSEAETEADFLKLSESLEILYTDMLAYNEKVNLTRLTTPEAFLYRHILDAMTLLPLIPQNAKLVDVGSGAGFPILPVLMTRPDVSGLAIESTAKKCVFIMQMAERLELADRLKVLPERAETVGRHAAYREQFDVATARAVAPLPVLLELCTPLVKPKGLFLAMKGNRYKEELKASTKALKVLGMVSKDIKKFEHPELSGSVLLLFEKQKPTSAEYPRTVGLPERKPL